MTAFALGATLAVYGEITMKEVPSDSKTTPTDHVVARACATITVTDPRQTNMSREFVSDVAPPACVPVCEPRRGLSANFRMVELPTPSTVVTQVVIQQVIQQPVQPIVQPSVWRTAGVAGLFAPIEPWREDCDFVWSSGPRYRYTPHYIGYESSCRYTPVPVNWCRGVPDRGMPPVACNQPQWRGNPSQGGWNNNHGNGRGGFARR